MRIDWDEKQRGGTWRWLTNIIRHVGKSIQGTPMTVSLTGTLTRTASLTGSITKTASLSGSITRTASLTGVLRS